MVRYLCFVGHHGRPVAYPDHVVEAQIFGAKGRDAARRFLQIAGALFAPVPLPRPPRRALARSSWRLAGLAVLADWIGSNQTWFPYTPPEFAPQEYLERFARPRAGHGLKAAGIAVTRPSPITGYRALTHKDDTPSPVQEWAEQVRLPVGPCLVIIEDMTGSGKTEAALIVAHRMIVDGRAQGLYIALPTMATANAMYERLAGLYRRLFSDRESPSLVLAHSKTRFHAGFTASVLPVDAIDCAAERDDEAEAKGDAAGAAAAAWLADSRRKAFLAEVGVGTIDQAFLAVLPAKHQSLRLFGLADRVLVVDEAHAYDTYMGKELERLLTFQAALGSSAVVLSATLPRKTRAALSSAFAKGLALTPKKQKRFCQEYLVDLNATGAARWAGYSAKTGPRLLANTLQFGHSSSRLAAQMAFNYPLGLVP